MQFLKSRFRPTDISLYFALVAIVLFLVSAIVYPLTGVNEFNPVISGQVVAMLVVAAAVELVSLLFPYREVRSIGFFLAIYNLIIYAGTQGNYLANLLVAIDNHTPSSSLISMLVMLALALACALASVIALREAKKEKPAKAAKEGE